LQDGVFFFLEAVILQADGVFYDPVDAALIALFARVQVGPLADRQLP
jgi:hypothetical protein